MLLKKLLLSVVFIFVFSFSVYSADEPSLSAQNAILINAQTKEIIFEKNAYDRHSMASTTKIMTSLLAIESGRMSEVVTAENMATEGTSIGLKNGYRLTLETLVWGMLLESGNDAAIMTANYLAGSEEAFSVLMNEKAKSVGMTDTNFVTASGLDDEIHYSTAYDMAVLGAYAICNPVFSEMCSTKIKTVRFIEPDISVTFTNHNKLLAMCEGTFGIKTGFTKKSGRCLVSACKRDGVTLVAVTLNAGDDWNDHIKLYNYGFENTFCEELYFRLPEKIRVYGGVNAECRVDIAHGPATFSRFKTDCALTQKVYLPKFIYAPISKGETIGKVKLYSGNKTVSVYDIVAQEDILPTGPLPEKQSLITKLKCKITEFFNNRKD